MTEVYIYIMGSNTNTDIITCSVPDIRNNEKEIFFGPCKKKLRECFRKRFMKDVNSVYKPKEKNSIYIIGLSRRNKDEKRCILWAGKITRIMSFALAYDYIMRHEDAYDKLLSRKKKPHEDCSLHVKPWRLGKKLKGYEYEKGGVHRDKDEWMSDLISKNHGEIKAPSKGSKRIEFTEPNLLLDRDCAFFCEPLFWAKGDRRGIDIKEKNDDFVNALKAQEKDPQKKKNIDHYFVFGRTKKGGANGLRGAYLPVKDRDTAKKIINYIKKEAKNHRASKNETAVHSSKC